MVIDRGSLKAQINDLLNSACRRSGSFPEVATQFFTKDVDNLSDMHPDQKDLIVKLAEATGEYYPEPNGEWGYKAEEGEINYSAWSD